jgi:hypothetical protein
VLCAPQTAFGPTKRAQGVAHRVAKSGLSRSDHESVFESTLEDVFRTNLEDLLGRGRPNFLRSFLAIWEASPGPALGALEKDLWDGSRDNDVPDPNHNVGKKASKSRKN